MSFFGIASPHRGDSNKYTKLMKYKKKNAQKYPLLMLYMGPIKFIRNSKLDFTTKSLVILSL